MNIVSDQSYMIFRNDFNGYSYYKIGISKKSQTGEWINGYIRCQFKKDVSLENRTKIYIRKAWLSFYTKDKETIPYIFINEFETIDETIEKSKYQTGSQTCTQSQMSSQPEPKTEEDPFKDFGEEIVLDENDLPF